MRVVEAGNNKGFTFTTGFTICKEKHNKSEKQIEKLIFFTHTFDAGSTFTTGFEFSCLCWMHPWNAATAEEEEKERRQ